MSYANLVPQEIIFAQMLQQLMNEKFKRNRSALAQAAHISPSALSQYVRGRATPSLEVLVHLADALDVSLDYLIFGQGRTAPPPDLGYFTGHLEAHLRFAREQTASMHDLIARIGAQTGAKIGDLISSIAEDLVASGVHSAGTLSPSEVAELERCDTHTTIVTADLSSEVLVLTDERDKNATAPGLFARVVADNLAEGSHYEYIVPDGTELRQTASLLRQTLLKLTKLDETVVDRYLHVKHVSSGCIPGFVIHHLVIDRVRQRAPNLTERIRRFVYPDSKNEKLGYVATVTPASSSHQHFSLVTKEDVPLVLREADILRRNARKLAATNDR